MNSRTLWNDNWYFAKTALDVEWEDRALWEREMQPADLPHDWLIYDTKNLYEDSIGWCWEEHAAISTAPPWRLSPGG